MTFSQPENVSTTLTLHVLSLSRFNGLRGNNYLFAEKHTVAPFRETKKSTVSSTYSQQRLEEHRELDNSHLFSFINFEGEWDQSM